MTADTLPSTAEIVKALQQDREGALAHFFQVVRPRLRRIVRFRLDYRLSGRVADSDVLQEAYVRAAKHLDGFLARPEFPFFVWLRMELQQMLLDIHRHHLQTGKRDPRREISLAAPAAGCQTSLAMAAQLVGGLSTPSRLVERAEQLERLRLMLEELPELDREVIALRHFEELSNQETAEFLGIEPAAASKRYLRALKRLKQIIDAADGEYGT